MSDLPPTGPDHHLAPPSYPPLHQEHPHEDEGHGGHRWMMIACCIPMLVIVGALVATGVAGTGAIAFAVICFGMMALMMFTMPGGHNH